MPPTDAKESQAALLGLVQTNPSAKIPQAALLGLVSTNPSANVSQVALLLLVPVTVHQGAGLASCVATCTGNGAQVHGGAGLSECEAVCTGHGYRLAAPLDYTPPVVTEECGPFSLYEESGPFLLTEESGPITAYEESGPIVATEEQGHFYLTEGRKDMRYFIIRGSITPEFAFTWRKADKTARDLTNATAARLVVSNAYETSEGSLDMDLELDFVDPKTSGQLTHNWEDDETDIVAGTYKAQVLATFPTGEAKIEFDFVVKSQVKAG